MRNRAHSLIILRIGKYVCHITMARSWLGCLFGVLILSTIFYLYLLLNGNARVYTTIFRNIDLSSIIIVPSADINSFKLNNKLSSSMDVEKESPRVEKLHLENNQNEVHKFRPFLGTS